MENTDPNRFFDHYSCHDEGDLVRFRENFKNALLLKDTPILQKEIENSSIFNCFTSYLFAEKNGLNIRTIIVEKNYTCQNYLEDYANYYAKCYTAYKKTCKRIHFFSKEFSKQDFENMIYDHKSELWNSYEGCIVAKPIPTGIFGVTYIKTYKYKDDNATPNAKYRHYRCLSKHNINLFGRKCEVTTMPFKEQDGVVASCATTALWTAFHKTAELFQTKAPSLSEITLLAGDGPDSTGKIFPSVGLTHMQVAKAIQNLGLVPEIKTLSPENKYFDGYLKGFIYAYLRADIPVLLGMRFEDKNQDHLVTLNGYRFNKEKYEGRSSFDKVSDYIDRFYAHDDQVGPFSRIRFKDNDESKVVTSWWRRDIGIESLTNKKLKENVENFLSAEPKCVIIPLSPTIKVTYEDILTRYEHIKFICDKYLLPGDNNSKRFNWDLFLIKNNDYKAFLYDNVEKDSLGIDKTDILFRSLPKYIWVIQGYIKDKLAFDFIFDSIEKDIFGLPISVNIYNKVIKIHFENNKNSKAFSLLLYNSFSAEKDKYKESLLYQFKDFRITSTNSIEVIKIQEKIQEKIQIEEGKQFREEMINKHEEMINKAKKINEAHRGDDIIEPRFPEKNQSSRRFGFLKISKRKSHRE
ncbi:MAG: hypothetical protein LBQ78_06240 [Tannerellaceae bacterium]|jgi:hypothetical protein|nr:hypothetical protein [Tannerellaceae bacterium]